MKGTEMETLELGEAQEVLMFLASREPRFDESPDWLKDCLMQVEQVVIGIAELIRERKQ